MKRLLYFVTEDWFFCSHWLHLAQGAAEDGYEVWVVTRVREHGEQILAAGFHLEPLEMSRRAAGPLGELKVLYRLFTIYRKVRPEVVHHMGQKPMVYGSIAAWLNGVPTVVNSVMGLGYLFISESIRARLGRFVIGLLFRLLLNRPESHVILENPDDLRLLIEKGILSTSRFSIIRGAGVDERRFVPDPEPEGRPVVMMASRLLRDKGVQEFVEAAQVLNSRGVAARFVLVGDGDAENPTTISGDQLREWQTQGIIEHWGHRSDMDKVLNSATIVCLPSYREGLPKVLLEAAACGRPIVATDVPGCREVVHHGLNGLLVPVRDSGSLARAIEDLLASSVTRQRMGADGRKRIVQEFTQMKIRAVTLERYQRQLEQTEMNGLRLAE